MAGPRPKAPGEQAPREEGLKGQKKARKPYKRPPQTSFLRPEIERSTAVLAGLQAQYDALSIQHTALQARLELVEKDIAQADVEVAQAMAEQAVGRPAQRWVHLARQQENTLGSLPPPQAWNPHHPMARWNGGQIRYLLYHTCRELGSLLRAKAPADQILPIIAKTYAFGNFQLRNNAGTWTRVKSCNFLTGELDSVPSRWFDSVAAVVPLESLPTSFIIGLRRAMSEYNKVVNRALRRRAELQRQLAELLPRPTSISELCRRVDQGGHDSDNRQLLLQRTTWQPQQVQQQPQQLQAQARALQQQPCLALHSEQLPKVQQELQQRACTYAANQCGVEVEQPPPQPPQHQPQPPQPQQQQPPVSAQELFRRQQQQLQQELWQEEQEAWPQHVQQHGQPRQAADQQADAESYVVDDGPDQRQEQQLPLTLHQQSAFTAGCHNSEAASQQEQGQGQLLQPSAARQLPGRPQAEGFKAVQLPPPPAALEAEAWPELAGIWPQQQLQPRPAEQADIDQLLAGIEETVAVELQATALASAVWMGGPTQIFAAHVAVASLPFQMDGIKISQALYERIVRAGLGQP